MKEPIISAIILAAGESQRMAGIDKIFTPVLNRPIIDYSISILAECPEISEIVVVLAKSKIETFEVLSGQSNWQKPISYCVGGSRRQDSVMAGLSALNPCDLVIIHDGARPCITKEIVHSAINSVSETGAATAGVPTTDTIKIVNKNAKVISTPLRETLWNIQTPQIFKYELIRKAHLEKPNADVTDDATLMEQMGVVVKVFWGSYSNIKITNARDIYIVESTLSEGQES